MALTTRIRGVQIKDADITETQLNASVNASLDLADSALQSIGAETITETELNASVNASLDLADSAMQSIAADSVTDAMLNDDVASGLAGSGLTATSGVLSVDAIASAVLEADIIVEDKTAECNGSNVTFELSNAPLANSVDVYLNGMRQVEGSGESFTISGTTVTFATAPASDDDLIIRYIIDNA